MSRCHNLLCIPNIVRIFTWALSPRSPTLSQSPWRRIWTCTLMNIMGAELITFGPLLPETRRSSLYFPPIFFFSHRWSWKLNYLNFYTKDCYFFLRYDHVLGGPTINSQLHFQCCAINLNLYAIHNHNLYVYVLFCNHILNMFSSRFSNLKDMTWYSIWAGTRVLEVNSIFYRLSLCTIDLFYFFSLCWDHAGVHDKRENSGSAAISNSFSLAA